MRINERKYTSVCKIVAALFVGADVGLDTVDVCYMGSKLLPKRPVYPNNLPGTQELAEQIARIMSQHDLESVMLGYDNGQSL